MDPKLYHLHALSALHCGIGQSTGAVDLPIARARATNLPIVPGSSLRGVLREEFADKNGGMEKTLFGPRTVSGGDDAHAGALALGDAHLLLLPIRALAGIVAYATCPFILKRYKQDRERSGLAAPSIPPPISETQAGHGEGCVNRLNDKVVLEDLDLDPLPMAEAEQWGAHIAQAVFPRDSEAQTDLEKRFLILPDAVFSFLAETATEIRTRIAIDQGTGTVKDGALWNEENLPAETVLWGVYALSDSRVKGENHKAADLAAKLPADALLQLGGKAGVGRGLVRFLNGGVK
ncbi:MAG: type III-B CRISPR module RAMP protein Cmr4 [Sulfuricellaceae bacterium]